MSESDVILRTFRNYDSNGNGVINRKELNALLKIISDGEFTDEALDTMMKKFDTNGDGKVQYEEFVDWAMGNSSSVDALQIDPEEERRMWIDKVKQYPPDFAKSPPDLQQDVEFVVAAVKNPHYLDQIGAIRLVSEDMKNNFDVVMAVVEGPNQKALQYVGEAMKNDPQIAKAALTKRVCDYKYLGDKIRDDAGFTLQAVEQVGPLLEYASADLQNDETIVMAAVSKTGWSLKFASPGLQNNFGIVMAAVRSQGSALEYASEDLRNNFEIVKVAVTNAGKKILMHASKDMQNNSEIQAACRPPTPDSDDDHVWCTSQGFDTN